MLYGCCSAHRHTHSQQYKRFCFSASKRFIWFCYICTARNPNQIMRNKFILLGRCRRRPRCCKHKHKIYNWWGVRVYKIRRVYTGGMSELLTDTPMGRRVLVVFSPSANCIVCSKRVNVCVCNV